jgi:hypothetical protein
MRVNSLSVDIHTFRSRSTSPSALSSSPSSRLDTPRYVSQPDYDRIQSCSTPVFFMIIDNFWPALNSSMGNTSSSAVQKCLEGALGKDVAFKSDPLFQLSHVKPYNLGISSVPAAVTYPKTSEQVGKIVKCAVDNSLKVQPRCGGHSYANYGTSIKSKFKVYNTEQDTRLTHLLSWGHSGSFEASHILTVS